jgi:hypothetical protein
MEGAATASGDPAPAKCKNLYRQELSGKAHAKTILIVIHPDADSLGL